MKPPPDLTLPHIVVIGAGFGGLRFVRNFPENLARITVIDRQNHHLFQPLLYQVATAGLSAVDIAQPVRAIFVADIAPESSNAVCRNTGGAKIGAAMKTMKARLITRAIARPE